MASEKTTQILDEIKALTILELADLVKAIEAAKIFFAVNGKQHNNLFGNVQR